MKISWGYSPKTEKFVPLGEFSSDKYLIIVKKAIENLGWKLSHISRSGIIAYTPLSFQSYSEEVSVRIQSNFAVVKSECVGIQLLFNDYGKNEANLEKLFHEFEYVQFHLQDSWENEQTAFDQEIAEQDENYFEKAPLAVKNKIKNVLYLLYPQKGYTVTPILIYACILALIFFVVFIFGYGAFLLKGAKDQVEFISKVKDVPIKAGALHRAEVLSGGYWRLITYQFYHAGIWHLFFNMYALVYLGLLVENKLGWKNFLLVYLLSGICGGLLSISYHEQLTTIGSSGSILGLFGALIALILNHYFEKNASKALLVSTVLVVLLMLINGSISQGVDNMVHIGGFISGFVFTYLLTFKTSIKQANVRPALRYISVFVVLAGFGYLTIALTPNYQHEEFIKLKNDFDRNTWALSDVLWMKNNSSQEEKLDLLYERGIYPAKNNLKIVQKMNKLVLNKRYTLDKELKTKLAKETYDLVLLIEKDIKSEHKYRAEIGKRVYALKEMQVRFADSLYKAEQ